MDIKSNKELYNCLEDLVEVFTDSYVNGERLDCFDKIKNIIDNELSISEFTEEYLYIIEKQMDYAKLFLESCNVSDPNLDKIVFLVKQMIHNK